MVLQMQRIMNLSKNIGKFQFDPVKQFPAIILAVCLFHPASPRLLFAEAPAVCVYASNYYVDNVKGKDTNDGKTAENTFATIARAMKAVRAGDTIHLKPNPEPYREIVSVLKGGSPDNPITLDGHGATISGGEPCPAAGWEKYKNGVFSRSDIVSKAILIVDKNLIAEKRVYDCLEPGEVGYDPAERRFFFNPGEPGKGKLESKKQDGTVVTVEPQQWQPAGTRIRNVRRSPVMPDTPVSIMMDGAEAELVQPRDRLDSGEWTSEAGKDGKQVMYYSPPAGRTFSDLEVECVVRSHGVNVGGNFSHVVIKNLTVKYVWNDGYGIAGSVTDIHFLNCNAHHCGDEGFSSHDSAGTVLNGGVFHNNYYHGIFNVGTGKAVIRNVILANNRSLNFGCHSDTEHKLENVILINSGISIGGNDLVSVDNMLMVSTDGSGNSINARGGRISMNRVTVAGGSPWRLTNTDPHPESEIVISNSLFASGQNFFHIRTDEPASALKLRNTLVGKGAVIQFNSRPPWKTLSVEEWLGTVKNKEAADNVIVSDTPHMKDIIKGIVPEQEIQFGCTRELLMRYAGFMAAEK